MKQLNQYIFLLLLASSSLCAFGQTADSSKMSSLMVYGDGFMFSVKEPDGWIGDTKSAADFYANVIFYRSKKDAESGGPIVQVYNYSKSDENAESDLQYDIGSYKSQYKNLKEEDVAVAHKEYKCYSKLIYTEGNFYTYLVYVNPGEKYKSGFSVAMNISKRPATEEELKAFREIIASLLMFKG